MLKVFHEDKEYEYDTEYKLWWLKVLPKDWFETNINPLTLSDITIIREECCVLCKSFDSYNTGCNRSVSTNYERKIDEPDEFYCSRYEEIDL